MISRVFSNPTDNDNERCRGISQGIILVGLFGVFFKPLSLCSMGKSKMLLYSNQQIFAHGSICFMAMIATVLNKGLGRRSRKMGEGSASVQLGFLKVDFVTSPVPKSAKRTSHVYALCRPYATDFFFL